MTRFLKILNDGRPETLPKLQEFSVDRCFKPPDFGEVVSCQLFYFSDASQLAYGAVSYLWLVNVKSWSTELKSLSSGQIARVSYAMWRIKVGDIKHLLQIEYQQ